MSRYRWRTENGKHRTYRRRRRNDNCVLQLPLPGSLISNWLFHHFLWFLIFLGPAWSYTIYKGGAGRWFLWRSSQTETSLHFCRTLRCCQVIFVWTFWFSSQFLTLLAHFKYLFDNYVWCFIKKYCPVVCVLWRRQKDKKTKRQKDKKIKR